jgi:hypothetical protein
MLHPDFLRSRQNISAERWVEGHILTPGAHCDRLHLTPLLALEFFKYLIILLKLTIMHFALAFYVFL